MELEFMEHFGRLRNRGSRPNCVGIYGLGIRSNFFIEEIGGG